MAKFVVTVKYPKNPAHDPQNKKSGRCPVYIGTWCTDSTGEHHSIFASASSLAKVESYFVSRGIHVTRIEELPPMQEMLSIL